MNVLRTIRMLVGTVVGEPSACSLPWEHAAMDGATAGYGRSALDLLFHALFLSVMLVFSLLQSSEAVDDHRASFYHASSSLAHGNRTPPPARRNELLTLVVPMVAVLLAIYVLVGASFLYVLDQSVAKRSLKNLVVFILMRYPVMLSLVEEDRLVGLDKKPLYRSSCLFCFFAGIVDLCEAVYLKAQETNLIVPVLLTRVFLCHYVITIGCFLALVLVYFGYDDRFSFLFLMSFGFEMVCLQSRMVSFLKRIRKSIVPRLFTEPTTPIELSQLQESVVLVEKKFLAHSVFRGWITLVYFAFVKYHHGFTWSRADPLLIYLLSHALAEYHICTQRFEVTSKVITKMDQFFTEVSRVDLRKHINSIGHCMLCKQKLDAPAWQLPCGHVFHAFCLEAFFLKTVQDLFFATLPKQVEDDERNRRNPFALYCCTCFKSIELIPKPQ